MCFLIFVAIMTAQIPETKAYIREWYQDVYKAYGNPIVVQYLDRVVDDRMACFSQTLEFVDFSKI